MFPFSLVGCCKTRKISREKKKRSFGGEIYSAALRLTLKNSALGTPGGRWQGEAGNVGRQTVIIRQIVSRSVAHTHTLLLFSGLHTTLCSSESVAKSAKSSKKEKKFEKKKPPSERPALADLYKPLARQSMTSRSSKRGGGTPAAIVKVGCRHENSTHASCFFVLLPTTTLPKFPWKFSRR